MDNRLLVERLNFKDAGVTIEESSDENGKSLYLKGVFIQGGIRNLNGRIYPVREIERAVEDINAMIAKGESVLGECDHPDTLTINLDRVSHMITGMWMDNNAGYGKLKILPTPMGEIIKSLIKSGVQLGVSSRGSGDVDNNGYVSEFNCVTVDIVAKPSASNALPVPVYESLASKRGRVIEDLAQSVRNDPMAQKYLQDELTNFIRNINLK